MHLYYFILFVVCFYSERPPLSKYFILCVIYFYSERAPLLQRNEAQDFGGVSQIYIYIYIFFSLRKNFTKQCFGLPQEWSLIYAPSTAMILETLGIIVLNIVNFKTFCDVRCINEIDLW